MNAERINVHNLRKEFVVSHSAYTSLKGSVLWWRRKGKETLTALDGISLNLREGECMAVIGRNGAGKSTLLGILARIYKPTAGTIDINGRVAPLLELGAGFHPDLTGYENVFFNGVVLGLTRAQVAHRMDSIVEFSEIGPYIDAPVRTYSSGMLLRLGFSVAMHVDASILLVDEALAVGDLEFQRKCMAQIHQFKLNGGSILFVSHDMAAVRETATRTMWLKKGRCVMEGPTHEVVKAYEEAGDQA